MKIHHLLIAFFITATLPACTPIARTPLAPQAAANIANVSTKLAIPGDEIIVRAQASNIAATMGYGLLPALIEGSINASRQSELESLSAPFYASQQVDFREIFSKSFNAEIKQQNILPPLQFAASATGISKSILAEKKAGLKSDAAFFGLRIWYEFSPSLTQLLVFASAQLINNQAVEPVYKNELVYVSAAVSGDKPLDQWAHNHGEALAQAFADSATVLAKLLKQDLAAPDNATVFSAAAQHAKINYLLPSPMPTAVEGHITEKSDHRQTIRANIGALYSTPSN
ncbi:hypothetical protein [Methylobacillus glycogenes]|uniref:hypothetical protein n=1 Tax=Methylobacillus glycogenes TaxID=406 RepID=UPI00046E59F0|nr:hypothetical protein [Methylobacillus glycogenes]